MCPLSNEPLCRLLEALPDGGGTDDLREVADSLCSEPGRLRALLTTILSDERHLHEVTGRSSVHPNGFVKVVPCAAGRGRLHIWPQGARSAEGDESVAHGHRWDFASWVIAGALQETLFDAGGSGQLVHEFAYRRDRDLHPRGTSRLQVRDRPYRPGNTVYTRRGTDLHAAEPVGDGLVASFVVRGRGSNEPAPVYHRAGAVQAEERAGRPDLLAALLRRVVEVLDSLS